MEASKKVLVIIVTFNGSIWMEECLRTVMSSTIKSDVLVIDNLSTDDTCTIVEKFQDVILMKNTENMGFGKANNIGLRYVLDHGYDAAFLLNQDTIVSPNMFEQIILAFEQNTEYGILSPIHLTGRGNALDPKFRGYLTSNYTNYIQDCILGRNIKSVYPGHFVNAAFWLISRECIEKVGGFDPIFFHRGEDRDYINRIKFKGFKIGVCPKAHGYHFRETRPEPSTFGDFLFLHQIRILENLKNPYNPFKTTYNSILRKSFLDWLSCLFRFRLLMAIFHWKLMLFTIQSHKRIQHSRIIESQPLPHLS